MKQCGSRSTSRGPQPFSPVAGVASPVGADTACHYRDNPVPAQAAERAGDYHQGQGAGVQRHAGPLASVFLEVLFSTLFAPVRMMFHSKFVFVTLMGQQVGWGGQQRSDLGTSWGEALRLHGAGTAFAFVWAAVLFLVNRSFFWWNTPIFIPLLLSIPFSVWSSRASMGRAFRRMGLFVTPRRNVSPAAGCCSAWKTSCRAEKSLSLPRIPDGQGFARAVADPQVNLLHRSLLRTQRKVSPAIANRRRELHGKGFGRVRRASASGRRKSSCMTRSACRNCTGGYGKQPARHRRCMGPGIGIDQ